MTARERFLAICLRKPVDRGLLWQERFWQETYARFLAEGMPADYAFRWDFDDDQESLGALGINLGYLPAWEVGQVADEGDTVLLRDEYGVIKRAWKGRSGMPQFVTFPVSNRADWERVAPRLLADNAGRFPADWPARVQRAASAAYPISFGGAHLCGFFSFLRELCGDEVYYLFADDPDLLREMLDFQSARLCTLLRRATAEVHVHRLFIWEDMAYKTGPLIGPETFRDFLMEPYQRYIDTARACGVEVIDLDSDGNIHALLPLWVELGINLIHPFEVAAGMDVVAVQRQYGERLAMRGGIDKRALAAGPAAIDVELARVRPAVDAGGYMPHVDHAIPPDVSWENYRYYERRRAEMLGAY